MPEPYRVAVVIPAFNEADRLPDTLRSIARVELPGIRLERVLVIDNGSTDGTGTLAERIGRELGLPLTVTRGRGGGKGAALRGAIPGLVRDEPGLDGVLFMDADNATDLSELAAFRLGDAPAVWIGSRYLPGSQVTWLRGRPSFPRRVLSRGMRAAARSLLGLRERDTQCGFKLVPAAWADQLFSALRTEGWTFDAELLARAHRAGLAVREVPVRWVERPGSKVRPVQDGLRSLLELVRIRLWLAREGR